MFLLNLNYLVEDINSQWRNLKDVFYKKQSLMEQKEAVGENPGEPVWRYYQPLKFLLSCEEERKNILRKRFHGFVLIINNSLKFNIKYKYCVLFRNYELAQLRQLRLRRTQAIMNSENRVGASSKITQLSDSYHFPANNVVLNAFKSKMKKEKKEVCNILYKFLFKLVSTFFNLTIFLIIVC